MVLCHYAGEDKMIAGERGGGILYGENASTWAFCPTNDWTGSCRIMKKTISLENDMIA